MSESPAPVSILRQISPRYFPILLAAIACIFYINTLGNEYALDDVPIIKENKYVQKGFDGLGDIFTSDQFASMFEEYGVEQQLSGGRYRPLAVATFAIEYQFFGQAPAISHGVNMLLYALLGVVIYLVFRKNFGITEEASFLTALLFLIHPIHTEVVANLKSRDELLSLLPILLSLRFCFNFAVLDRTQSLVKACMLLFLALLAKEYAVVLFVMAPLALYTFYPQVSRKQLLWVAMAMLATTVLYAAMRISIVGATIITQNDPLNNPYIFATPSQQLATKIFVLLKYLLLLFFPYPLSSDYSYATIAFRNFNAPLVWCSIAVYLALGAWAVYAISKRQKAGFAIAWYLAFLAPVSNMAFDIGATMGERLIFHASLGFCLILALGAGKLTASRFSRLVLPALTVLLVAAAAVALPRNRNWKNDDTLFLHDIHTVPNSILVNNNAADALIRKADRTKNKPEQARLLKEAKHYTDKALALHPKFVNALINQGLICYISDSTDQAMYYWLQAKAILPNDPHLPRLSDHLMNVGLNIGPKNLPLALDYLKKSVQLNDRSATSWSNLGGAYHTNRQFDSALYCWRIALSLNPNDANAKAGYNSLSARPGE